MTRDRIFSRYVKHNSGSRTEYAAYGVWKEETKHTTSLYFTIQGTGVKGRLLADNLGELLEKAEEKISVSEGRRTQEDIDRGTEMTSTHHERFTSSIEDEIEEYDEETTAEEWLSEVKN